MRHPRYLEMPWNFHWDRETTSHHRYFWWLVALLVVTAVFFLGARVMSRLIIGLLSESWGRRSDAISQSRRSGASPC